jgi:hypothetical protein
MLLFGLFSASSVGLEVWIVLFKLASGLLTRSVAAITGWILSDLHRWRIIVGVTFKYWYFSGAHGFQSGRGRAKLWIMHDGPYFWTA